MAQGQAAVVSDPAGNIVTANGTSFSSPIGRNGCLFVAGLSSKKQIKRLEN
jgi:hypothetical protein